MQLIMYDLDGTLIDTASEIASAVNLTLESFAAQPVSMTEVRTWIGHGPVRLMQQAAEKIETGADWEAVMKAFNRHYQQTVGTTSQPYPFVMDTLMQIREGGIKQAVVTNKESLFTQRVLQCHGMDRLFDLVINGDTLPVRKPDPTVLQHCMRTLGSDAETSLFVGDSEIDVATARGAGVRCWVVPYGYNGIRDIRLAGADRQIGDVRSVLEVLHAEPCISRE